MKLLSIAVLGSVVLMSSCSVYRSGQTPDDLYYTPTREVATGTAAAATSNGYVPANSDRDDGRRYDNYNSRSGGYSAYDDMATMDDRWLMMRVRNRSRWSMFDNYGYNSPYNSFYSPFYGGFGYQPGLNMGFSFGNPYSYGFYNPYSFGYYNHFNNYYNWNYNYNPYYGNIIVVNPKTNPAGYTRARSFNMRGYNNNNVNSAGRTNFINGRARYNTNPGNLNNNRRENPSSNRRVFSNSRTNERNNNSYSAPDRPVRTYTPSTNNSSNSPSSSGGSRPSSGSSGGRGRPGR